MNSEYRKQLGIIFHLLGDINKDVSHIWNMPDFTMDERDEVELSDALASILKEVNRIENRVEYINKLINDNA